MNELIGAATSVASIGFNVAVTRMRIRRHDTKRHQDSVSRRCQYRYLNGGGNECSRHVLDDMWSAGMTSSTGESSAFTGTILQCARIAARATAGAVLRPSGSSTILAVRPDFPQLLGHQEAMRLVAHNDTLFGQVVFVLQPQCSLLQHRSLAGQRQ